MIENINYDIAPVLFFSPHTSGDVDLRGKKSQGAQIKASRFCFIFWTLLVSFLQRCNKYAVFSICGQLHNKEREREREVVLIAITIYCTVCHH